MACWGAHGDGESSPPAGAYVRVSAGSLFACGIKADGTIACWGENTYGQGTPPSGKFAQVSAVDGWACAVDMTEHEWCWGQGGSPTPVMGVNPC